MRVRVRNITLIVALVLVASAWTCSQAQYQKAAEAAKGFALSVSAFQDTEIIIYNSPANAGQNLISTDEHKQIQQLLINVADAGKELNNAILVAKNQPGAVTALQESINACNRLLNDGVLHVKNPDTMAHLQLILISAKGFLATISTVIQ